MKALPIHKFARGFTLLEILVTVAIMMVLAFFLFPSLKRMRERADESRCMSNLKQIGQAAFLYAGDNDGALPAARSPTQPIYWLERLDPPITTANPAPLSYLPNALKLACPTYKRAKYFETRCSTYSWNTYFGFVKWVDGEPITVTGARKLVAVKFPAKTSLVLDGSGLVGADLNDYYGSDYGTPTSSNAGAALHHGGFHALFVDGHVEWVSKSWITNRIWSDVFWGSADAGW